jgi:hypothetical protein
MLSVALLASLSLILLIPVIQCPSHKRTTLRKAKVREKLNLRRC